MTIINTVSAQRFSCNGIEYFKNFLSRVIDDRITIYNAYDSKDELISNELFSNITINGSTYGTIALTQQALLPVIYTRDTLGGGGGGGSQSLAQTLLNGSITDGENINISDGDGVFMDNGSRLIKGVTNAGRGGAKGIALKCSIDYEYKWEAGVLYVLQQNGFTVRETRHNFNIIPDNFEDETKGFVIGSRWILDNGDLYVCMEQDEGSAIWELQTVTVVDATTTTKGIAELATSVEGIAGTDNTRIVTPLVLKDVTDSLLDTGGAFLNALNDYQTASQEFVDAEITALIGGAPANANTLNELNDKILAVNTNAVDKITVKLSGAINKGQAVYVSGAQGTNIVVSKASNASEATSSKTLGLLETSGANNSIVNVITSGLIDGIDTSSATIGDPVWLGVAGNLLYGLVNEPIAPAHLVYIGVVSRVSATVGEIIIKVQNGFQLKEIHDVLLTSVANNEGLFYDSATSLWKNKTIDTVLGGNPVTGAGTTGQIAYFPSNGSAIAGREIAEASFSFPVNFDIPRIYFNNVSPTSADITDSIIGAKIGVIQKIYHNKSTIPTFPATWVRLGTTLYAINTLNIIYCEYVSSTRVEYWIVQA
jgi:hypothetical protein